MATLAQNYLTVEPEEVSAPASRMEDFELRPLPFEDVYFRPKKMDNSRLVREADPRAGSACWKVIGAACFFVVLLGGVVYPNVANTVAGYKLEALRVESKKLADEQRVLELQQAQLQSPDRLDKLAQERNLVEPSASQVVHLESKGEGKVAMVNK